MTRTGPEHRPASTAPPAAAESTLMYREAAEAPDAVARQLESAATGIARVAAELKDRPGKAVVTLARGSSDHAATYARYLLETRVGLLTSSLAPSVSSLYARRSHLRDTVVLAISQSGRSPDLAETAKAARDAGAFVVAIVNAEDSPLAALAHCTIGLGAGTESSVAATKSFIASLAAIARLAACWSDDRPLLAGVDALPDLLRRAWALDWSRALPALRGAASLYTVGRGVGLGIAQEAALKLKETCAVHAEAFSAAELRHGPMAIVEPGFPVLVFAQDDEARPDLADLSASLAARGAAVITAGLEADLGDGGALSLPVVRCQPALQPILHIQGFYRLANVLAIERGRDPDRPPFLSKVTETT